MTEPLPETVASEPLAEVAYLRVTRDIVRFADGQEASRAVVWHPGAVALVVLDEQGRWLLVRQYRHPARRVLLEVPAGTIDPGETPEETAARELREETGFAAGRLERLGAMFLAPGYCSEYLHYFLATDLSPAPLPQDEDERLSSASPMTLDEVYAAVDSGAIEDAKTVAALVLFERYRARKGA